MTGRGTKKLTLRTDLFVTFIFREACFSRNCKCLNDCHERAISFECGRQQSAQKAPLRPRLHLSIDWRLRHLTGRHPIVEGRDVSLILPISVLRRRVLSLMSELLHDMHYTVSDRVLRESVNFDSCELTVYRFSKP